MLESGVVLGVIGIALSAILGGVGSSLGVSMAGTKGAGALAENPNLFGKLLIISALPGSQGVYGFVIAIMILVKLGAEVVPVDAGWQLLLAGAVMGFSGLFSGWLQGRVAAGGVGAVARDESVSGKALVLSVLVETYAILGLVIAILIWNSVQI